MKPLAATVTHLHGFASDEQSLANLAADPPNPYGRRVLYIVEHAEIGEPQLP